MSFLTTSPKMSQLCAILARKLAIIGLIRHRQEVQGNHDISFYDIIRYLTFFSLSQSALEVSWNSNEYLRSSLHSEIQVNRNINFIDFIDFTANSTEYFIFWALTLTFFRNQMNSIEYSSSVYMPCFMVIGTKVTCVFIVHFV